MANFNTPTTAQQEEQIIDFNAFVRKYKRYWWLFLLSLVACMSLAFAYLKYAKRVYNVKAVVLVAQDDNKGGAGANLLKSMKLMGGGNKVDDEMIVFASQELCSEVAKQLGLNHSYIEKKEWYKPDKDHYNSTPIEVIAPEEMFDTLSVVKFKIDVDKQGKTNIKATSGKDKLANIKGATLPAMTDVLTGDGIDAAVYRINGIDMIAYRVIDPQDPPEKGMKCIGYVFLDGGMAQMICFWYANQEAADLTAEIIGSITDKD